MLPLACRGILAPVELWVRYEPGLPLGYPNASNSPLT